jgi:hypothetical protein
MKRKKMIRLIRSVACELEDNQRLDDTAAELRAQLEDAHANIARLKDAVASLKSEQPWIQSAVFRAVAKAGYTFQSYRSHDREETRVVVENVGDSTYDRRFVREHADVALRDAVEAVWNGIVKASET